MKNVITGGRLIVALLSLAVFAFSYCKKEKIETSLLATKISTVANEGYKCPEDLKDALAIHNKVMNEVFNGQFTGSNYTEFVQFVTNSVETKVGISLTKEQRQFVQDVFNKYINTASFGQTVSNLLGDNLISANVADVLMQIDREVENANDSTYEQIHGRIVVFQKNLVDLNPNLSSDEKCQLTAFLTICENGAYNYRSEYEDNSGGVQDRESCKKCLKKKIWQILLGDGAGGILGAVACAIWPPACPVLLPVIIAIGSAGVLAVRCPQCVGL